MSQIHEDIFRKGNEIFFKKLLGISHLTHEGYLSGGFCPGVFGTGGFCSGGLCPDTLQLTTIMKIAVCGLKETSVFCLNFEGYVLTSATVRAWKFVPKSRVRSGVSLKNQIETEVTNEALEMRLRFSLIIT